MSEALIQILVTESGSSQTLVIILLKQILIQKIGGETHDLAFPRGDIAVLAHGIPNLLHEFKIRWLKRDPVSIQCS